MTIRLYLFLFVTCMTFLSLGSYALTRAYFTDTAVSGNNVFMTAENFGGVVTPTESDEETQDVQSIVINEVFESASNSAEWVELYNTGTTEIDVSGWTIGDGSGEDTFPQSNSIPVDGYAVIVTINSQVVVPGDAVKIILNNSTIGSGLNSAGGDVVILKNGQETVDLMSYGTNTALSNPPALPTNGLTLQRIPNGVDTDAGADWQSANPTLGDTN